MADISKITALDGTTYDIKDATARSAIANLPTNNLQNLIDGSSTGSVRGVSTSTENSSYTIGTYAFAEGTNTKASGNAAHAEGSTTIASSEYSHAEGRATTASGSSAHAEGTFTTASGQYSHAEGNYTIASESASHAEGTYTEANGIYSHAEGQATIASHVAQHVFGRYNEEDSATGGGTQYGNYVEIVGNGSSDNDRSNARTLDWNGNEILAGKLTIGTAPVNAMDVTTKQYVDTAIANNSSLTNLVDGSSTGSVRGVSTSAEDSNYTIGSYAFAEGYSTNASGLGAHAEGNGTTASGASAHAEGYYTIASGEDSHAEGYYTTASGFLSHVEGHNTIANHAYQHVFGQHNIADSSNANASDRGNYIEIVGNGTNSQDKSNARTLDWDGNEVLAGTLTTGTGLQGDGADNHKVGVIVKTDIDASVIPSSSNQWYRVFAVKDTDDDVRGYFGAVDTTTSGQGVQMETCRTINNELIYNGLQLRIKDDGTRNVAVSDPAAWCTAINAVNKSGDTMTGSLNIYGDTSSDALLAFSINGRTTGGIPQIRAVAQATNYQSLAISGAQALILGSGESALNASSADLDAMTTSTKENLYLLADNELAIYTGCQTIADAVEAIRINNSGEISNNPTIAKSTPYLYLKHTGRTEGTAPSGNQNSSVIFQNNEGNTVALLNSRYTSAKRSDVRVVAQGFGTGSAVSNELRISVADDGTRTIGFSDAAPWRSALGLGTSGALPVTVAQGGTGVTSVAPNVVFSGPSSGSTNAAPSFRALVAADIPTLAQSKISGLSTALEGKVAVAGDTMTGNLLFTGTHGIYESHASCVVGTAPDSTAYNIGYRFRDKNNTTYAYLRGFFGTDNAVGVQFEVTRSISGSAKYHNLTLRLKSDGTRQVSVSEQEPWQVGLGLSQSAVTITKPTTTPSGISTNGTFRCYTAGHVVMVQWESLLTTASPATSWTQLASGFPKPSNNIYFEGNNQNSTAGNRMRFRITTGGILQYAYGTASATHAGTMTYIIP